jgi:hypothetical protein
MPGRSGRVGDPAFARGYGVQADTSLDTPFDWLRALSPSTMLGTLSLPNGLHQ